MTSQLLEMKFTRDHKNKDLRKAPLISSNTQLTSDLNVTLTSVHKAWRWLSSASTCLLAWTSSLYLFSRRHHITAWSLLGNVFGTETSRSHTETNDTNILYAFLRVFNRGRIKLNHFLSSDDVGLRFAATRRLAKPKEDILVELSPTKASCFPLEL